ncbi:A24 family peptidase [Litorimonas sp. WD9-15]|uniref:A24 family peptidase n=1 Tax=Litorimonas sp. WD9-15 TaxID=3418716 RepID=UPI003D06E37E
MAALNDANAMKIPNRIPLIALFSFFLIIPFTWGGVPIFLEHLTVGLAMFALGFAMFAFGWMGGGDSKLLAGTAIWFTWPDMLMYAVFTSLFGGVLTLVLLVGRTYIPVRILTTPWAQMMLKDEKKIPYGLALAAGAIFTLPHSRIFAAALGH